MGSSASKQQIAANGLANDSSLNKKKKNKGKGNATAEPPQATANSTVVTDGDSQRSIDRERSTSSRPASTQTSASGRTDSERPSSSHSDSKSIGGGQQENPQQAVEEERMETPGVKEVEVISINNPENYEDETNQTGLSHYEMKIIDSFYSVPERPRSRAYNEAKQAAHQRRTARKAAKESRRKNKKSANQTEAEPNSIAWAMENTKKLGILNLSKMNLAEIPDQVFDSMPGTARFINISSNQLVELDVRLCDYVLVQRLTANANLLSSIPATISRMTALKKLDLAHNKLTHLPDSFSGMRLLEHVDLSENKLSSLPRSLMLLNLTALNVSHNLFEQAPVEIASMEWLMDLDFSSNRLRRVPAEYMNLSQLISFNLDDNQIVDFPNEIFESCTALVTLRLRRNPITMATLQAKDAYDEFDTRRKLKLKRQLDAGSIAESDLMPADS